MASITVRDVPDEARDELAARAARSGRSLQEYLRKALIELAARPDPEVLVSRIADRKESYDAWYVALAELLDAPLATLDQRLPASSGSRCRFVQRSS